MADSLFYPSGLPCPRMSEVQSKERRLLSPEGGTAGPLKTRVLQRDLLQREQVAFLFTFAQAEVFRAWWRDTLVFGGCWFGAHWPLPQGVPEGGYRFRRFVGAPTWSEFLPGVGWSVTAVLEVRGLSTPEVIDGGASAYAMGWLDPVQAESPELGVIAQSNAGTLINEPNGGSRLWGAIARTGSPIVGATFTLASWEPVIEGDDPPDVSTYEEAPRDGFFALSWFIHYHPEDGYIIGLSGGVAKVAAIVQGAPVPGFLQATCTPTYFEGLWDGYANLEWLWVDS